MDLDDDRAEAAPHVAGEKLDNRDSGAHSHGKKKKQRGQNHNRRSARVPRMIQLCSSVASCSEFSPTPCPWGKDCRFEHDLRAYVERRQPDLDIFDGVCPVFKTKGWCEFGWKCLFVKSHSTEEESSDGRPELRLLGQRPTGGIEIIDPEFWNLVSNDDKFNLSRRKTKMARSEQYVAAEQVSLGSSKELKEQAEATQKENRHELAPEKPLQYIIGAEDHEITVTNPNQENSTGQEDLEVHRASYRESRFLSSEKRRLYFGPETPVLAPLTTQGKSSIFLISE